MSVRQLLASMSSTEITEWMAYDTLKQNPPEKEPDTAQILKARFAHLVRKKK